MILYSSYPDVLGMTSFFYTLHSMAARGIFHEINLQVYKTKERKVFLFAFFWNLQKLWVAIYLIFSSSYLVCRR